jgi:hypothetical protein
MSKSHKISKPPTFVQTELFSTASEELQREVARDLATPDPEDKKQAIATLIEDQNEDTQ